MPKIHVLFPLEDDCMQSILPASLAEREYNMSLNNFGSKLNHT